MKLDTNFVARCIASLERAFTELDQAEKSSILYDIYRAAVIKEFEIILEQLGKLLRKKLKSYGDSSKEIDQMTFKAILRKAGLHGLINIDEVEKWMRYRESRNATSHDYEMNLAETVLEFIPQFIIDAKKLLYAIEQNHDS